ncbi:TPA: hypothetical protein VO831_000414 [Streptococcus pyogenes]|nr:hypothetical protein [Streptococcus pyogenes]HES7722066.1 hypothetical protein [Streptococcus pyogenes]
MKKKLMLATALLALGATTNVKAEEETTSNPAEERSQFVLDGDQQKIYDDDGQEIFVYPFKEGDSEIKVWLPYGSSVRLYRKLNNEDKLDETSSGELVELEDNCYEVKENNYENGMPKESVPQLRFRDGYKSYYGMNQQFTIPLYKDKLKKNEDESRGRAPQNHCPVKQKRQTEALKKNETLTFIFGSNGFYSGKLIYKNAEEVRKKKSEQEKEYAEEVRKKKSEQEKEYAEEVYKKYVEYDISKPWYQRLSDSIQDQWWNFKGWLRG